MNIDEIKNKMFIFFQFLQLHEKSKNIDSSLLKDNKYALVFRKYYNKMSVIINRSDISKSSESELLPAMFIVCDYSAASSGKDRRSIANNIMNLIMRLDNNFNNEIFDKRCDLYGQIIRGKEPRYNWFLGDTSAFNDNAVSRCGATLCDILFNPPCADDYESAPFIIYGIDICVSFTESVALPLMTELVNLFTEIYDL